MALERYPASSDPNLRAWSAAEEHLVAHLEIGGGAISVRDVLVLGDPFGAVTTAIAKLGAVVVEPAIASEGGDQRGQDVEPGVARWGDSYLAAVALERNLAANGVRPESALRIPSTHDPAGWTGRFATAVVVIPKSLALLEYMLEWMKSCLRPGAAVLAGGMTRHLSPHVREILEARIGPTSISRVYKKSVVFTSRLEEGEIDEEALTPAWYEIQLPAEGEAGARTARIYSYPGVFGAGRLDRGSQLLMEALPIPSPGSAILDLGCGSGVLALALAFRSPDATLALGDESYLAAASARLTFEENGLAVPEIRVGDGCEGFAAETFDLVVSNPPFHAQSALTIGEATRLFAPVRAVLRPGGRFFVVGAHGVDYGPTLRRIFPRVERIASDRRYAVHRCDRDET